MSKKTARLEELDKRLMAGMEEVTSPYQRGAQQKAAQQSLSLPMPKAIREGLGMSQAVFCRAYGIPLKTLQHWEQRRRNPDRTASAYLWTIEEFPDQVREAQQRHQTQQPTEIGQRPGAIGVSATSELRGVGGLRGLGGLRGVGPGFRWASRAWSRPGDCSPGLPRIRASAVTRIWLVISCRCVRADRGPRGQVEARSVSPCGRTGYRVQGSRCGDAATVAPVNAPPPELPELLEAEVIARDSVIPVVASQFLPQTLGASRGRGSRGVGPGFRFSAGSVGSAGPNREAIGTEVRG